MTSQALKEEFRAIEPEEAQQSEGWVHHTISPALHEAIKKQVIQICIDSGQDLLHGGYGVEVHTHKTGIVKISFSCTNPNPDYIKYLPEKIYIFRNGDPRSCQQNGTLVDVLLTITGRKTEINAILENAGFTKTTVSIGGV